MTDVFRGLILAPPQDEDPSEGVQPGRSMVVSGGAFDQACNELACQPDGQSIAPGVNFFVELPPYCGSGNFDVGEQMRYRAPALRGTSLSCAYGL